MRALSLQERRISAVLLLLAVLVSLILAIAIPYNRIRHHYADAISSRLDRIARYQRIIATLPEIKQALSAVHAKSADKFFLKSSAPSLDAADIQQTVQTLVTANGLQLDSLQIAQPRIEDGYRKITLNLRLRGTMKGLQNTLYTLETGKPYLFIDNLSITTTVGQNYKPVPGTQPNVAVQFDLYGYSRVIKTHAAPRT